MTYNSPMAKMHAKPTLFTNGICSFHTIGMGNIKITISRMTSTTPTAVSADMRSPHLPPGMVGFQYMANGWQIASITVIAMMAQAILNAIVVCRNFEGSNKENSS